MSRQTIEDRFARLTHHATILAAPDAAMTHATHDAIITAVKRDYDAFAEFFAAPALATDDWRALGRRLPHPEILAQLATFSRDLNAAVLYSATV